LTGPVAIGLYRPGVASTAWPAQYSRCATPDAWPNRLGRLGRIHRRLLGRRPGRARERIVRGRDGPPHGAGRGQRDLDIAATENLERSNYRRL